MLDSDAFLYDINGIFENCPIPSVVGIRNHLSDEIHNTCDWQKYKYSFYCTYWSGLLVFGIKVCLEVAQINCYRNKDDVCNAVMVRWNIFFTFKDNVYVANWLPYECCSRPRSETLIWYFWVISSYIHLYGLDISIKASRCYHGNNQVKNMSIDEAPCEAFNLIHILELPIVGHFKPYKEFFVRYENKI